MHRKQPMAIANKHAMEELQVFLRAMSAAQRHWGKKLTQQENNVRRLMMVEDHCREELKRNVLRATHKNLKYLVNTDLLTTAQQAPTPPPAETFLFYDIPAQQVSAFSMYAMSRLWTDPERVDVPAMTLIADLQSAWAILPPAKRQAYEQLADIFRAHLDAEYTRRVAAEVAAESAEAAAAASATAKGRGQRAARRIKAARKGAAASAASAASGNETAAAAPRRKAPRSGSAKRAAAQPTPPTASSAGAATPWERAAFDNFVKISHKHMQAVLRGGGKKSRGGAVGGGSSLSASEWLPIAQAEWATKSQRQKRCFAREGK